MPRFRYTAVDADGLPLTGDVDGASAALVREALRQQGLQVQELLQAEPTEGPLSAAEAAVITQQISLATQSELPLVGSLRAFAEEIFSQHLRHRLMRVCDALESGEPLQKVLSDPQLRLPSSVASIMRSGLPPAAINHLLSLSVRAAATTADLRARTILLLTYPILMICAIGGFWLFLLMFVTHEFAGIFADFGVQISPLLAQLIELSRILRSWNGLYLLSLPVIMAIGIVVYCFALPAKTRQRLWCGLPIIGSMYRLTSLSELARLLAVMLESQVPLPQALSWSGGGINDADLQDCCSQIAARLRQGEDAITAAGRVRGLPSHLEQMLRFAAHGGSGGPPLRSMARLLELRAKSLSLAAMPLMEPLLLTAAVVSVVAYVLTVFPPLIKLLNDLS